MPARTLADIPHAQTRHRAPSVFDNPRPSLLTSPVRFQRPPSAFNILPSICGIPFGFRHPRPSSTPSRLARSVLTRELPDKGDPSASTWCLPLTGAPRP
ncbi:hypothetical protein K439DRAFT_1643357 [Ramaria rubella]|nr:hypothetical protein K439DRAFT_1643357 [Ramaria rubella]